MPVVPNICSVSSPASAKGPKLDGHASTPLSSFKMSASNQEGWRSSLRGDEQICSALRALGDGSEDPLSQHLAASPDTKSSDSNFAPASQIRLRDAATEPSCGRYKNLDSLIEHIMSVDAPPQLIRIVVKSELLAMRKGKMFNEILNRESLWDSLSSQVVLVGKRDETSNLIIKATTCLEHVQTCWGEKGHQFLRDVAELLWSATSMNWNRK